MKNFALAFSIFATLLSFGAEQPERNFRLGCQDPLSYLTDELARHDRFNVIEIPFRDISTEEILVLSVALQRKDLKVKTMIFTQNSFESELDPAGLVNNMSVQELILA